MVITNSAVSNIIGAALASEHHGQMISQGSTGEADSQCCMPHAADVPDDDHTPGCGCEEAVLAVTPVLAREVHCDRGGDEGGYEPCHQERKYHSSSVIQDPYWPISSGVSMHDNIPQVGRRLARSGREY